MKDVLQLTARSVAFPAETRYIGRLDMPPIKIGEIIYETLHFRIVTDYKPGLEEQRKGERFFLEPKNYKAAAILLEAATYHNIYNFNVRRSGQPYSNVSWLPALRIDYTQENIPALFQGFTEIPEEGKDSIPSPDRLEECMKLRPACLSQYRFSETEDNPPVADLTLRHLKQLYLVFSDVIPNKIIHSTDPNPWFKVRKSWFTGVRADITVAIEEGLITDKIVLKTIQDCFDHLQKSEFFDDRDTLPEDIARVNAVIQAILDFY